MALGGRPGLATAQSIECGVSTLRRTTAGSVRLPRRVLRQVFFLLLLNSADAFRDRDRGSRGRKIQLRVDRTADASNQIVFVYSDTAGGMNPAKLRMPDQRLAAQPVEQRIFGRGVTSKKYGTGLGLWIARQIMRRHYGSIELRDYRHGGVTFVLRLPTDLDRRSRREKADVVGDR